MKTKYLPLIIGIALPLVFILVISIIVFSPSFFIKPRYNFLYSVNDTYYPYDGGYKNTYVVENGHVTSKPLPLSMDTLIDKTRVYRTDLPKLYLYDVKNNTSHEVTLNEAKSYSIDPGPASPDGYTVKYEYPGNSGIFELFGSRGNGTPYFIEKDNGRKTLTGLADQGNYYYSPETLKFIGWVK